MADSDLRRIRTLQIRVLAALGISAIEIVAGPVAGLPLTRVRSSARKSSLRNTKHPVGGLSNQGYLDSQASLRKSFRVNPGQELHRVFVVDLFQNFVIDLETVDAPERMALAVV